MAVSCRCLFRSKQQFRFIFFPGSRNDIFENRQVLPMVTICIIFVCIASKTIISLKVEFGWRLVPLYHYASVSSSKYCDKTGRSWSLFFLRICLVHSIEVVEIANEDDHSRPLAFRKLFRVNLHLKSPSQVNFYLTVCTAAINLMTKTKTRYEDDFLIISNIT